MKDILKWVIFGGLFIIPCLTLYVADSLFFPFITGKNFAFRIIVEVIFACWLLLGLYDSNYRPKFSWILATFLLFLGVMLIANLHAIHVLTAIWSNFERMDGYVTVVHVFLYFIVLGSMFKTQANWNYFFHVSIAVACIVSLKGLSQLGTGTDRIDSTLGNSAYMAVYMLFHIFFLIYLFIKTKITPYRIIYTLLGILFVYVLLQTGTRGTAIGLAAGIISMLVYLSLFASRFKQLQKYSMGAFVVVLVMVAGFISARDTAFIHNTPALERIASINLGNDLQIRKIIWGMAIEGIKQRPILGWGQGNFNYVFNAQYDPRLYGQEQWFDRVHDIVLDWLIAGGILGFLAYVSIFAAIFYYLIVRPLRQPDNSFTVLERSVLVGLVIGYITHNLVVFDNIVSYIFFGTVIALIHSRVSVDMPKIKAFKIPESLVTQVFVPVTLIAAGVIVYFVNIPALLAAGDVIVAFQAPAVQDRLTGFELALSRDSFARQEITEQLAQQAMGVETTKDPVDPKVKAEFAKVTEAELDKMIADKPEDARLRVFLASYYRSVNNLPKAKEQIDLARKYSPKKQAIILQQGAIALSMGDNAGALGYFKEAYELDTTNDEAREYYVAALFYNKDAVTAKALIDSAKPAFKDRIANSGFALGAIKADGDYAELADLYEMRVAKDATNAQDWTGLAFMYYQLKQNDKAIETLKRAGLAIPSFASTGACFSKNIQEGKTPEQGCIAKQ